MIRKLTVAATAAGLALGGFAMFASPAGAAKPTITATGNVTCTVSGKVKITPPLTNINTSPSLTTSKTKGVCTGSTESGVTPTKAKGVLSSQGVEPGTCTGLLDPAPPEEQADFTIAVSWKGSGGKINPSTIVFPGFEVVGIDFVLNDGDVTGSYAGTDNATVQATPDIGAVAAQLATCDPNEKGKVKGVKKIPILGGTLTIT